ncbi:MAG: hypothetical protein B7Y32_07630 [Methylophilales bacterium 16-45-7]|nr:MAG: hypothetical protein B7Y32_07630 [Methylophilales bacterium 16-45-7]
MLQSITLGSTAKYAMINGQTIMLGQAYQQWILIKLTANEAILRAKDGSTKVLVMGYPVKKSSQSESAKWSQALRQPLTSNAVAATPTAVINTNNRINEVPGMHTRAEAESVWVKQ